MATTTQRQACRWDLSCAQNLATIRPFLLNLIIAVVAGYLAGKTVPAGASFLAVCRVTSLVTFLAYACGVVQGAIWMGKPWNSVAKEVLDAFIYGLVSALAFAWLWPR